MVHGTVTVRPLKGVSRTSKLTGAPSVAPASAMAISGSGSSSAMVPVAVPSTMVAPVGSARRSQNVSVCSSRASPSSGTVTVASVARAAKVTVPDAAV